MAPVVGRLQRVLPARRPDRAADRDHQTDLAAPFRRLRADVRARCRERRQVGGARALPPSPQYHDGRPVLLSAGPVHRCVTTRQRRRQGADRGGLRAGEARRRAARLLAHTRDQHDRNAALRSGGAALGFCGVQQRHLIVALVLRFRSSPCIAARSVRTSEAKEHQHFYDSSAAVNLKFLNELAAIPAGTSNSPHESALHRAAATLDFAAARPRFSVGPRTGIRMALSQAFQSIMETRRYQMFPTLEPIEIERVRRFGELCAYTPGEALAQVGVVGRGLTVMLSGHVEVTQRDEAGRRELIVTYGPGQFMGELATLAGRPALVDAHATEPVEALIIPPERLRALLIGEAELGERIMRALILRRIGLLESGAGGPVIIGRPGNGDVLRLEGFLRRNGHPHHSLDPETDTEAKALIERFHVDVSQLPIVLCPDGELLRNPSEMELARCIGLVTAVDPTRLYDVAIVGAGPAGLATAVYAASEGLSVEIGRANV